MLDNYSYLSGELRHLAFRKGNEQATWQNAIKQQRVTDLENRLGKLTSYNFLAYIVKALSFHFIPRRRTQHQPSAWISNMPSHHKAG